MSIDPRIPLGVERVSFANKPMDGLRDLMALRESQQRQQSNQIKLQEQQREQAEAMAFQQIIAQTGDDWEEADKLLAVRAPGLRQGYLRAVHDARQSKFKAKQEESAASLAEANVGLRSIGVAIENPEVAEVVLAGLERQFPDIAPLVQQIQQIPAGDPKRVEAMKTLRLWGLDAEAQIKREDDWAKAAAKGDFSFAGQYLADAQQKGEPIEQAASELNLMGMPKQVVAALASNPQSWTMSPVERSQEADRSADNARDQAQFVQQQAERERANRAGEGLQVRGQDLSAATQRRGQDLSASTQRRGQDLTDARAKAEGGSGVKLSATAIEKIAGVDTALGSVQSIASLLPTYESKLGPIAGRMASGSLILPGADQGLAEFAAEVSTLKNAVVKATTGAAMSEPEAQRIMSQVPDLTNQPAVFRARMAATKRNLETLKRRTIELSGGTVAPAEQPAGAPELSGLRQGMGRTFREGPYAGQTWTLGPDGQPKRVR